MERTTFAVALALAFLTALPASFAQAQVGAFVAAQGSDSNPCTFALPCRSFQKAHDTVAANGEIDVLDSADYGVLNITKAVNIQGHGFSIMAQANGWTNAIMINAGPNDKVSLHGLLIDGGGVGNNGITFRSGASLDIQECLIRNFIQTGLSFEPNAAGSLSVSDTRIAANSFGISVGVNTKQATTSVFNRVVVVGNLVAGLQISGGLAPTNLTVSDSIFSNNGTYGVDLERGSGGAPDVVTLRNVVVSYHEFGIAAKVDSLIRITKSTITGNGIGLYPKSGGQIVSFGDNSLAGNTTDGVPTSTILLK
ncbi:right-handed parallel beta-helix repeat-containing protein [Bradyrhizobium sp. 31Argb]|uniref:right-handed parallel beta-helix repeat-containing protein n=1 Tax=Bradyrhizobium sp. 31Argb TaxID=3141247 RepID=UPI0037493601